MQWLPLKITPSEIYAKNIDFPNAFMQQVTSVYRNPRFQTNGINLSDIWDVGQAESFYRASGMSEMWNQFIRILGYRTISMSDIPDVELLTCSFVRHLGSSKFADKCTFGQVRRQISDMDPLLITKDHFTTIKISACM